MKENCCSAGNIGHFVAPYFLLNSGRQHYFGNLLQQKLVRICQTLYFEKSGNAECFVLELEKEMKLRQHVPFYTSKGM